MSGGGTIGDEAVTALTVPSNDEERAALKAEQQAARRYVARRWMLKTHACTGRACADIGHMAYAAVRDDLLIMLGLKPDPDERDFTDLWGRRQSRRNR